MEKRPVGIHTHRRVRIQSKRGRLPDSWDLSTSVTRVGYLVLFPHFSNLEEHAGKAEN